MVKPTFICRIIILFSIILSTSAVLAQGEMYEISMGEQAELSTQIVEGKVISKRSFWDENRENIYTAHTIEVYKVFKGQSFNTIEVITKGGVVNLDAEVVSHSLNLRNGDLGVFMLSDIFPNINPESVNNPAYKSVSASQGFYKYSIENDKVVNTFNTIDGITNGFYEILLQNTQTNFIEIEAFNIEQRVSQFNNTLNRVSSTASILSFTTSSPSAGTKSVLTISGSNFGSTQGTVGFSNANYGGVIHTNALDNQVISWSDSEIKVEIPDYSGTGTIKVNTISNGTIESSNNLLIDFAQINLEYDPGGGAVAYQTQHINANSNGGYTWEMNNSFSTSSAKQSFERAFNNWSCETGINWEIASATTSVNLSANDDVNVITFDIGNPLPAGVVGQCYSRYSGCAVNGEIQWFVEELDIVFNDSNNWNYSTNPPVAEEIDFETAAVHELGHGHQLGHVVDTNVVMHYSISSGESLRTLSDEDISGANDVQSRSTTTSVCSQLTMTESSCALLGTNDFNLSAGLKIFPNPARGEVFIKNSASLNIDSISLYNLEGRLVYNSRNKNYGSLRKIDISHLSQGVYFVNINTEYGILNRKLIVR
jgi:hypothetical protein